MARPASGKPQENQLINHSALHEKAKWEATIARRKGQSPPPDTSPRALVQHWFTLTLTTGPFSAEPKDQPATNAARHAIQRKIQTNPVEMLEYYCSDPLAQEDYDVTWMLSQPLQRPGLMRRMWRDPRFRALANEPRSAVAVTRLLSCALMKMKDVEEVMAHGFYEREWGDAE
ncbi:MAG: hypothetical protein Q9210_006216 [Variospora velana]